MRSSWRSTGGALRPRPRSTSPPNGVRRRSGISGKMRTCRAPAAGSRSRSHRAMRASWGSGRMAEVTFDHVKKSYGPVTVIEDFSLAIRDQEFMVLVGPSGCGKSTALRMIAGLEEITGGTVSIGDRVVNDVPPKDRDIAMVFQSYAL